MPRRPDVPCAGCGKLLFSGTGSLPVGQRLCRACRGGAHPAPDAPPEPLTASPVTTSVPVGTQIFTTCLSCGKKEKYPPPAPHMCSVKPPTPSELEELRREVVVGELLAQRTPRFAGNWLAGPRAPVESPTFINPQPEGEP